MFGSSNVLHPPRSKKSSIEDIVAWQGPYKPLHEDPWTFGSKKAMNALLPSTTVTP